LNTLGEGDAAEEDTTVEVSVAAGAAEVVTEVAIGVSGGHTT